MIATSRRRPTINGNYSWLEADFLTEAPDRLLRGNDISHVLHTAWCVEHGKFWTDSANDAWRDATIALARIAASSGVQRFISLGTCYEYDWPAFDDCNEQTSPIAHHTRYDISKTQTRHALENISIKTGMDFCWPRLFSPFGSGEPPARLIPYICQSLIRGIPAKCASGNQIRDFIAVSDIAELLADLCLGNVTGCVNVTAGKPTTIAEVASSLGKISGRPDLIRLGARPDREGDPLRITGRVGRIALMPSFPSIPSLEQRLTETLELWKVQGDA